VTPSPAAGTVAGSATMSTTPAGVTGTATPSRFRVTSVRIVPGSCGGGN
jgi:hypothetical protein